MHSINDNELLQADLTACVRTLREGGLILYPTDTIWGIGCDATSDEAVRRVYALKQRADHKAMLTLADSPGRVMGYVAPSLLGPVGSLGIRVTRERFSHALCERFRRPIVSTSANLSGQAAPGCYDEVSQEIIRGVDYVVHYRRTDRSTARPSGIIRLGADGTIQVIRE